MPPKRKNQNNNNNKKTTTTEDDSALSPVTTANAPLITADGSTSGHNLHLDMASVLAASGDMIASQINSMRRRRFVYPAASSSASPAGRTTDAAALQDTGSGKKKKAAGGKKGGGKKKNNNAEDEDDNNNDDDAQQQQQQQQQQQPVAEPVPMDEICWTVFEEAVGIVDNLELLLNHLCNALRRGDSDTATMCTELLLQPLEHGPDVRLRMAAAIVERKKCSGLFADVFKLATEDVVARCNVNDDLRFMLLDVINMLADTAERADIKQPENVKKWLDYRNAVGRLFIRRVCTLLRDKAEVDREIGSIYKSFFGGGGKDAGFTQQEAEHRVAKLASRLPFGFDFYRQLLKVVINLMIACPSNKELVANEGPALALTLAHTHDLHMQVTAAEAIFRLTRTSPAYFRPMESILPESLVDALRHVPSDKYCFMALYTAVDRYNKEFRNGPGELCSFESPLVTAGADCVPLIDGNATIHFSPLQIFIVKTLQDRAAANQDHQSPNSSSAGGGGEALMPLNDAVTAPYVLLRSVRVTAQTHTVHFRFRQAPAGLEDLIFPMPTNGGAAAADNNNNPSQTPGGPHGAQTTVDCINVRFDAASLQRFKQSPVRTWMVHALKSGAQAAATAAEIGRRVRQDGAPAGDSGSKKPAQQQKQQHADSSSASAFLPSVSAAATAASPLSLSMKGSLTPGFAAAAAAAAAATGAAGQRNSTLTSSIVAAGATELRAADSGSGWNIAALEAESSKKSTAAANKIKNNNKSTARNVEEDDDAAAAKKGKDINLQLQIAQPSPMPKNPQDAIHEIGATAGVGFKVKPGAKKAASKKATAQQQKKKKGSKNTESDDDDDDDENLQQDKAASTTVGGDDSDGDDVNLGDLLKRQQKASTFSKSISMTTTSQPPSARKPALQQQEQERPQPLRVESEPPFDISGSSNNHQQQQQQQQQQQAPLSTDQFIQAFRDEVQRRVDTVKEEGMQELRGTLERIQRETTLAVAEWETRTQQMHDVFTPEIDKLQGEQKQLCDSLREQILKMNSTTHQRQHQLRNVRDTIELLHIECENMTSSLRAEEKGRVVQLREAVEAEVASIQTLFSQRVASLNPLHTFSELISRSVPAGASRQ